MDFNLATYKRFILTARAKNYEVLNLRTEKKSKSTRKLLIRHDVDFSLYFALKLAQAEADLGISTTYFILVDADFYDIDAPSVRAMTQEIHRLGHEIGLHWDISKMSNSKTSFAKQFTQNLTILGDIIGEKVVSVAQHIPIKEPVVEISNLGMNDAYDPNLFSRYEYVSDSGMVWRKSTPIEIIKSGGPMYLLIHPIWWIQDGMDACDKLRTGILTDDPSKSDCVEKFILFLNEQLKNRKEIDKKFKINRGIEKPQRALTIANNLEKKNQDNR